MSETNIHEEIAIMNAYLTARDKLNEYRNDRFPCGAAVIVNCDRYRGPGVIEDDPYCPIEQVAVTLPNGNCWWYSIRFVTPHSPTRRKN